MSVTQTARFNVYRWSSGADSFTRSQLDTSHAQLEALAAGFVQSATRPTAGLAYTGFIFFNTATEALEYCDGTQWIGLNSYGSPSTQAFDDAASDGVATTVARSDHKHGFPGFGTPVSVSTSNQNGIATTVARSDHQHRLADLIISGGAIQADSVDTDALVDGSVTQVKMASGSVGSAQIIVNSVTSSELAPDSVSDVHLQANSVGSSEIKDGAVGDDQVSSISATKITGTVSSSPDIDASQVVSGTLLTARIPNLDAGKVTSSTFSTSRIPGLDASKITSGTINTARIPSLAASKITSGNIADARGPFRIKTNFAGADRESRIYVNTNPPSGGQAYDIWIEY